MRACKTPFGMRKGVDDTPPLPSLSTFFFGEDGRQGEGFDQSNKEPRGRPVCTRQVKILSVPSSNRSMPQTVVTPQPDTLV